VRVFEGGQPGYAILVFEKQTESASLRLAVKSVQVGQGAFLSLGGSFEHMPSYFDAVRVMGPRGGFGYQVGPDVVNYMLDDDQIEVSSEDGQLRETGYWANATPSMIPGRGRAQTLVASGTASTFPTSASPPESPPPTSPPEPKPPESKPPASEPSARETPPPVPLPSPAPPSPGDKKKLLLAAAALLALIAAAGFVALSPGLRCSLFGNGCTLPPETSDAAAAQQARQCAALKTAASLYCDEEIVCFAPYRREFPQGVSHAEIEGLAVKAAAACATAESESYRQARQCADNASSCIVPSCFVQYRQNYSNGAHADQARDDLARARRACDAEKARPNPIDDTPNAGPSPLGDGEYLAYSSGAPSCGIAKQRALHVFVCSGRINWVHEAPLAARMGAVPMQWEGSIDARGKVVAAVRGNADFSASARISETERTIDMHYPDCETPISMTISRALSSGCSEKR
jgi:hypothetical protein